MHMSLGVYVSCNSYVHKCGRKKGGAQETGDGGEEMGCIGAVGVIIEL